MIRFIDLGDQICEGTREFAFYCTIVDNFLMFDGCECFCSWKEFDSCMDDNYGYHGGKERFKSLCPEWVFNAEEEGGG